MGSTRGLTNNSQAGTDSGMMQEVFVAAFKEWRGGGHAVSENIWKHAKKHMKRVGAKDEADYMVKAVRFKDEVLASKIKGKPIKGTTEDVLRYTKGNQYVDLDSDKKVISYGSTEPW